MRESCFDVAWARSSAGGALPDADQQAVLTWVTVTWAAVELFSG